MKLYLEPKLEDVKTDNGVGQVVAAQYKHLPRFGINFVDHPSKADITAAHISSDIKSLDVLHCHGLHWTADHPHYKVYHDYVNSKIVDSARRARAITVPSEWVAMPFKRDMGISPHVIGHGIDLGEWERGKNKGYILWNKNRISPACDPSPAVELFKRGANVVSTFGLPTMNPIGRIPYQEMKRYIQETGVYLSTSQETFGIGTLEALACGVPVLGYDIGGNRDIVNHMSNGYLVAEGDIDGLVGGLAYIMGNYSEMSDDALKSAQKYGILQVMKQYADLYKSLLEPETHKTSVIITNYNYGRYLPEAINSCLVQSVPFDEIIVVDDGSTDESRDFLNLVKGVKVIFQENKGVASARNRGVVESSGDYILFLDADDMLHRDYLKTLLPEISANRDLGIVYGGLQILTEDERSIASKWPPKFDWNIQSNVSVPPSNCIPSAALFRREMWKRAGGVIQQGNTPGEDVEFWTRGLSKGFKAKRVTESPLFRYRVHKGQAHTTKKYKRIDSYLPWMRTKDFPFASPHNGPVKVRSYSNPVISVIIPVGPGHEKDVNLSAQSVLAQSITDTEIIIVNDSGSEIKDILGCSMIESDKRSAGGARNLGVEKSRGELIYFLDSDDYLLPGALEGMLQAYKDQGGDRYIYTDYFRESESGKRKSEKLRPYNQFSMKGQHAVNILINKEWLNHVNGFDENLEGWEDFDLQLKLQCNGFCGYHASIPTFVYRISKGRRRAHSFNNKESLLYLLNNRYKIKLKELEKESKMAGTCCGGGGVSLEVVRILANKNRSFPRTESTESGEISMSEDTVRMEYIGSNFGGRTFTHVNSKKLSKSYRGGSNPSNKYANANPGDVDLLELTGMWQALGNSEPVSPASVDIETPLPANEDNFSLGDAVVEIPAEDVEILATEKALELAAELGVNVSDISGSGKDGKVTLSDVKNFLND